MMLRVLYIPILAARISMHIFTFSKIAKMGVKTLLYIPILAKIGPYTVFYTLVLARIVWKKKHTYTFWQPE